jgi:hypothetical protein
MLKGKTLLIAGISLIVVIGVFFGVRFILGGNEDDWICENGSWVKHGNPDDPMPTTGCGEEDVAQGGDACTYQTEYKMTYSEARKIAEEKCVGGSLTDNHFCNPDSGTWWIDFIPDEPKEGCNPACVVFVDSGQTEINWRCTGLVIPDN